MILLLVGAALADPDAVRVPTAGLAASVGSPGFSGVGWFGDQGIGAAVGGSVSVFGAARTPVRSGWGAGLTFGVAVPLADPTLALETSAWIGPAWHGRWLDLGVDLVVPAAASPFAGVARFGARVEPRLGVHLRGVAVSVSGGAGIVESTDSGWAMDLRAAVGFGYHPE